MLQLMAAGERQLQLSTTCPLAIAALVNQCLALDPADRPSALALAYEFRLMKQRMGGHRVWEVEARLGSCSQVMELRTRVSA